MFWAWWILIGAVAAAFITAAVFFVVALAVHRKIFYRRYDGNKYIHYFTAEDFAGLRADPVCFPSDKGQMLRGAVYSAEGVCPIGVAVFSHGFGAGHLAYTTEIDSLARAGFLVLAFDGTGCVSSEGKALGGFDQGAIDLRFALRFAARDARLRNFKRILVGHSWGGFSVMNTLDTDVRIEGAAALCGFVSSAGVIAQNTMGKCRFAEWACRSWFKLFNRVRFGKYANFDAVRSLKRTQKPVLLLYGEEDATVCFSGNGARVREAVHGCENIVYRSYPGKGHNIYLTVEAERYMHKTFGEIAAKAKKDRAAAPALYAAADYRRMTEEDAEVMETVLSFCRALVLEKS